MNHNFSHTIFLLAASFSCPAQIPVSKEPRHHNVFENAWVRVLDVHIPPGDTSLFHKHDIPSVFLVLSNTKTGSEVIIEPARPHLTEGNIWFEGFYDKPRIHRVWNSDTAEFHVIDMELSNKNYKQIDSPLDIKAFKLLFDEKPVRAYRLTLNVQATIQLTKRKAPVVVVGLTDGTGDVTVNNKLFVNKGDFIFIKDGNDINFINKGRAAMNFALFELK